jgi:subtilisin family serine protease
MAPFGDGAMAAGPFGDGEEGEDDARWGWDPLRSGSAPPTMDGAVAARMAADGVLPVAAAGCGRGGGGGPFFSGAAGLGPRFSDVGRHRGVVGQVRFRGSSPPFFFGYCYY